MNKNRQTEPEDHPEDNKPKFIAQKCPVCNGWGTVSFKRIPCHACESKGYINIPIEIERKTHGTSS